MVFFQTFVGIYRNTLRQKGMITPLSGSAIVVQISVCQYSSRKPWVFFHRSNALIAFIAGGLSVGERWYSWHMHLSYVLNERFTIT